MIEKKKLLAVAIIWILAIAIIIFFSLFGPSRRIYSPRKQVFTVAEPSDAYSLWQTNGVKGRVLFLFDRRLNAETVDDKLTPANYNYVAIRNNTIRKIFHIISNADWPEVERSLSARPYFIRSGSGFRFAMDGAAISIMRLQDLPRIDEPVLVNLNALLWGSPDMVHSVCSTVRQKGIRFDIMTVSGPLAPELLEELKTCEKST